MPQGFPNNPTNGQAALVNGSQYQWDGVAWRKTAAATATADLTNYATVTDLAAAEASIATNAASVTNLANTKADTTYVDAQLAGVDLSGIASNATDISALQTAVAGNDTDISNIQNTMSTDTERLAAVTALTTAYDVADTALNNTLTTALAGKLDATGDGSQLTGISTYGTVVSDSIEEVVSFTNAQDGDKVYIPSLDKYYTRVVSGDTKFWTDNATGDKQQNASIVFTEGDRGNLPTISHSLTALTKEVGAHPNFTGGDAYNATFFEWQYSSTEGVNNLTDKVECTSNTACYGLTELSTVYHPDKGFLTQEAGVWKSSDNKYLGKNMNEWFDSTTYANEAYSYDHGQYLKSNNRRVDNNQIWGDVWYYHSGVVYDIWWNGGCRNNSCSNGNLTQQWGGGSCSQWSGPNPRDFICKWSSPGWVD